MMMTTTNETDSEKSKALAKMKVILSDYWCSTLCIDYQVANGWSTKFISWNLNIVTDNRGATVARR